MLAFYGNRGFVRKLDVRSVLRRIKMNEMYLKYWIETGQPSPLAPGAVQNRGGNLNRPEFSKRCECPVSVYLPEVTNDRNGGAKTIVRSGRIFLVVQLTD